MFLTQETVISYRLSLSDTIPARWHPARRIGIGRKRSLYKRRQKRKIVEGEALHTSPTTLGCGKI
jgi:hypothetical protein